MTLEDIGYNEKIDDLIHDNSLSEFALGRVIAEHKERYVVITTKGEFDAEVTGKIRFTAKGREDFPAVGDWVAVLHYEHELAIIHKILPRFSILQRQAVDQYGEVQLIATNIDVAFLMQATDRDFNINRLERYLTICYTSSVSPIIVLTKADLFSEDQVEQMISAVRSRIAKTPILAISNQTQRGYELLKSKIEKGKTYCMLGSSGVGKSTLLNNLLGKKVMSTESISQSTNKGRHVTSHRELVLLPGGGILIDTPGMREVGIADSTTGLETTFNLIASLSGDCKYKDCTHTTETGCAVIDAVNRNEIDRGYYENFLRMERERAYFQSTLVERRKKDKAFGKFIKNYKKDIKKSEN